MMNRIPKKAYTTEFKELAVKRVSDGEAVSVVVKELSRLRAEVARLKRENEIIKKAAAYFAKDVL